MPGEVSRQQVASFLRLAWYVSSLLLRMAGQVLPGHEEGKVVMAFFWTFPCVFVQNVLS